MVDTHENLLMVCSWFTHLYTPVKPEWPFTSAIFIVNGKITLSGGHRPDAFLPVFSQVLASKEAADAPFCIFLRLAYDEPGERFGVVRV